MKEYFERYRTAAPLAIFRIAFGLLLCASVIRFWAKGWIHELYIQPKHFFPFYGFEFIQPLGEYTYLLFFICGASALLVALGLFYRFASITLFLSFTYIELIDKTTYLNHYYFVSMVCLLLIFLPANVYLSVDAVRNKKMSASLIPNWTIDSIKLLVCILYFYAGIAKINSDWLLEAQPLRLWLPARNDTPIIGFLFNYTWIAYAFSWAGCLYDLAIPFLLWNKRTTVFAYLFVVIFHTLTSILFPIGMFPFIMMATALIFFSDDFHLKVSSFIARHARIENPRATQYPIQSIHKKFIVGFLAVFFAVQVLLPFRYLFYPGNLFWTEQGYRFSWRVMLVEKAGSAQFIVRDKTGKQIVVDNKDFLTTLQEKQMSIQPDMILQYAHILRDHYKARGFVEPEVYVDSYVALNGRLGKPLIDPTTNLAGLNDSFAHKTWILPVQR